MKIIHFDSLIEMPWKNGQGISYEILKLGSCEHLDSYDFDLRLSMAKINGKNSFSKFSGHQRYLTIVRGQGIYFNDQKILMREVIKFDGEQEVLSGPLALKDEVIDLGVIFNPTKFSVEMNYGLVDHFTSVADKTIICFLNSCDLTPELSLSSLDVVELNKYERISFPKNEIVWVSINFKDNIF